MSTKILREPMVMFENTLKNNGREIFNHWVKMKEQIGENNIEFFTVENLFSEDNKVTVITKNSIFEIKLSFKNNPDPWFTTPIYVNESKKKIKEKRSTYNNKSEWEVVFVYDDETTVEFTKESLRKFYYEDEINEEMFLQLISI